MPRNLIFVVAAIALMGCSGSTEDPADPAAGSIVDVSAGRAFDLKRGGIARLPDGLLVKFDGISSDSRCPRDVTCVWEGDAAAEIGATIGRMAWTDFSLHTTLQPRSTDFREWTITLIAVQPYPRAAGPIRPGDYVVTLEVAR